MRDLKKMRQQAERDVLAWKHPVGTKVVVDRVGGPFETKTRSDPWVLGQDAVILVEGISGGYLLSRVRPVSP